jgi:hypothetical protein
MPPSADDLPGRTPPRRKPSAGGKRKPGKQPGSPGSHLAWSEYRDDMVWKFTRHDLALLLKKLAGQPGCQAAA